MRWGGNYKKSIAAGLSALAIIGVVIAVAFGFMLQSAQGVTLSGRTSTNENTGIWNYGASDSTSRPHRIHMIGDTWMYCVHDGPDYNNGVSTEATEANARRYLGQDLITELAIAYDYIWNQDLFKTPGGRKLKNDYERHAVMQCVVRAYCMRDGLNASGAFGSNRMYVGKKTEGGEALTGHTNIPGYGTEGCEASTEVQKIYDYVKAHKDEYVGHALVAVDNVNQEVAGMFWLESVGRDVKVAKTGTSGNATLDVRVAANSNYDLSGAEFTLYTSKSTSNRAKNVDGETFVLRVARQSNGTYATNTEKIAPGTYYVRETKAPKSGYQIDTDGDGICDNEDPNPTDYWYSIKLPADENVHSISWNNLPFFPEVDLTKYTSKKDMNLFEGVKDNPCYDILGAQFMLYEKNGSVVKDIHNQDVVFTVNSSEEHGTVGKTNKFKILPEDYYLRETRAPNKGFRLDADGDGRADEDEEMSGSDTSGHKNVAVGLADQTFTWTDPPMYDPDVIYLVKYDSVTGRYFKIPEGDADLNGAQYRISYYKGIYTRADQLPAIPDATAVWTTRTGTHPDGTVSSGTINFAFDAPTSGTWKYNDNGGNYAPLGTLVIEEVVPPEGYLIDSDVRIVTLTDDGTHRNANVLRTPYNQDGTPGNDDWNTFLSLYQLNGDRDGRYLEY